MHAAEKIGVTVSLVAIPNSWPRTRGPAQRICTATSCFSNPAFSSSFLPGFREPSRGFDVSNLHLYHPPLLFSHV